MTPSPKPTFGRESASARRQYVDLDGGWLQAERDGPLPVRDRPRNFPLLACLFAYQLEATIVLVGNKRAPRVVLNPADRAELKRVVLDPDSNQGEALRSTAMLMAAEPGMTTDEVARRVGVPVESVRKWQETLHDERVRGLIGPESATAIRNHTWAGNPSIRVAMILRLQADVLQNRFDSLKKTWTKHCSASADHLGDTKLAAVRTDQNGAAPIEGARRTPTTGRATRGPASVKLVPQPTRVIVKELRQEGWTKRRNSNGSHSQWEDPSGRHTITVPDGHRTMSTAVVRTIRKAIADTKRT